MGVNIMKKYWEKINNKIVKFGVGNLEHLLCIEKFEAEILKKIDQPYQKPFLLKFMKLKFGISPIKSRALDGWMNGWVVEPD